MKRIVLGLLAVCLSSPAQDLEKKLDEQISSALKKAGAPSVSVAVVNGGRLVYAKAFGSADLEANRAADANTRYAAGSISKQFTVADAAGAGEALA